MSVKGTLTALRELPEGRTGVRETHDFYQGVKRMVRGLGRRASGDVDALAYLADLERLVDEQYRKAVHGCLEAGWSYRDVARVLGVSRQAVHHRFGPPSTSD